MITLGAVAPEATPSIRFEVLKRDLMSLELALTMIAQKTIKVNAIVWEAYLKIRSLWVVDGANSLANKDSGVFPFSASSMAFEMCT